MRPLSIREKQILVVCLGTILVYFFYNLGYKHLKDLSGDIRQEAIANEKLLKKNLRVIQRWKTLSPEYESYFQMFQQKAGEGEEMSAIISQIESIANQLNIRLSEIKPRKVKNADFYNVFPVNLTLECNLQQISEILYILQTPPYLFDIEEFHLEKRSSQELLLQARLVVSRTLIPD